MQEHSSNDAIAAAVKQGCKGHWTKTARGGVQVVVSWDACPEARHDEKMGGRTVVGKIHDHSHHEIHDFELGTVFPLQRSVTLQLGAIEITLLLHVDGHHASLVCNLPLSRNEFFNGPIGEWPLRPRPADEPGAGDDASVIEAPHDAMDLFPFVWMHPPGTDELLDAGLRFVRLQNPADLPLYVTLSACTGSGAAAAKQAAASTFRASTDFVSALSMLPEPVSGFPALRLQLLHSIKGEQDLVAITLETEALLGETLESFFANPDWATAQASVWQSLFVLALVGTAADSVLANQLVDVLRTGHFLMLLQESLPALEAQRARCLALAATPALPDAVATASLTPGTAIAAPGGLAGSWEVLGLGTLKVARQRLAAYLPGELADVVNVMPRERQERQEHLVTRTEEGSGGSEEQRGESDDSRQSSATSELTDAMQEVMAAEGIVRNMSNVTPSYENLNQMLTGSWAGGNGGSSWSGQDASRLVQQLTEKAARHLGDRVTRQRGRVWQELCERRHSNLIDNTGNDRLVGVYRWVDRLMRVHLEESGRRLVLAFLVDSPASAWVDSIAALGAMPLQKPQPLAAFAVANGQGYADITAANYQAFAAQYGICNPELPPPDSLTVMATVNRVVVGDLSVLRIPDGYTAASGQMTVALADNQYNLVCSIAGQDVSWPAAPVATAALTVVVPVASASTTVGNATVQPPVQPVSVVNTVTLSGIKGLTGPVPVTVMSAAPLLGVTAEVLCSRGLGSGSDPLLVAWQMRSYDRLLQAWQAATRRYEEELALRVDQASAGHTGEVQRDTLRQDCLSLLPPASVCALEPLLGWRDMSWHYEPWPVGSANPWPRIMASSSPRLSAERLFQRFLQAPTARVLVPVSAGCEAWLLFCLQFPQPWVGGAASTPVTESTLLLLEEILGREPEREREEHRAEARSWTVRLPTSMLYLQQGSALPELAHWPDRLPDGQGSHEAP